MKSQTLGVPTRVCLHCKHLSCLCLIYTKGRKASDTAQGKLSYLYEEMELPAHAVSRYPPPVKLKWDALDSCCEGACCPHSSSTEILSTPLLGCINNFAHLRIIVATSQVRPTARQNGDSFLLSLLFTLLLVLSPSWRKITALS